MKRALFISALLFSVVGTVSANPLGGPPNDDFANATSISSIPYETLVSNVDATNDLDELGDASGCNGGLGSASVWYRFDATVRTSLTIEVSEPSFDWSLSALVGTTPPTLHEAGCMQAERGTGARELAFAVAPGATLYLRIAGNAADVSIPEDGLTGFGTLRLRVTEGPGDARLRPAANDLIEDATVITSLPFADDVEVWTATRSPDDPTVCDSWGSDTEWDTDPRLQEERVSTVWYRFEPGEPVRVIVDPEEYPETTIGVYRQVEAGLELIGCSNESAQWDPESGGPGAEIDRVGFSARPGERYQIAMYADHLANRESFGLEVYAAPVADLLVDEVWLEADPRGVPGELLVMARILRADVGEVIDGARVVFTACNATTTSCKQLGKSALVVDADGAVARAPWATHTCTGEYVLQVRLLQDLHVDTFGANDVGTTSIDFGHPIPFSTCSWLLP